MKSKYIPLFVTLILFSGLNAQMTRTNFIRFGELMTGVSYQTWSSENDEKVSELVVPMTYIHSFSSRLNFSLVNMPTSASMNSTSKNLSGLTDTRLNMSYVTLEEKMLLSAGVSLPTGQSGLEGDQVNLASALAINALDFRVPSLGQGLDLKGSMAFAHDLGGLVIGGGIGFLYKGKYKPFKNYDLEYDPGNEITFTAGGDQKLKLGNTPAQITGDITYTLYGQDKADGKEVFKSGNKIVIELRSLFKLNQTDFLLYLRNRSKGKNERGLGSLNPEPLNSNGNQLELGGVSYFPIGRTTKLKAILESRMYSKNQYENNGASIFGIGTGLRFNLAEKISFDSHVKYLKGSLKNRNASTGITGLELGGTFLIYI